MFNYIQLKKQQDDSYIVTGFSQLSAEVQHEELIPGDYDELLLGKQYVPDTGEFITPKDE